MSFPRLNAGEYVYLGTATGKLLQYRVSTKPSSAPGGRPEYVSVKERGVDAGSSRSPVMQLEAIADIGLLAALCDGGVSLHRLTTLDRVPSVLDSKGAVAFSVNTSLRRICVVSSKRRLKLYDWVDGNKFAPLRGHPELDVPDVPRALAYYGPRICLGYSREYNILYEDTGEVHDIPGGMNRDTRPLVKHLPGDKLLLVCADEVGVVVNASGEPVTSAPVLQFRHPPLSLGYCYPYILSVAENSKQVEVHASRDGRDEAIQLLPIPAGVVGMADGRVGATTKFEVDATEAASKGRNPVFVAFHNPGRVVRLQPVPIDRQVEDMLRQYQVSAATDLVINTCPDQAVLSSKLARINIDAGRVFFFALHFEQAFAFLKASPLDPRELLQVFPDLLPGSTTLLLAPSSDAAAAAAKGAGGTAAGAGNKKAGGNGTGAASSSASSTLAALLDDAAEPACVYRVYASRYLSFRLTQDMASGAKQPCDAASEAADAPGGVANAYGGAAGRLGPFMDGTGGNGVVQTGVADIAALVRAQFAQFARRIRGGDGTDETPGDTGVGAPSSAGTVDTRLLAAYTGMLIFLRHRRRAIRKGLAKMAARGGGSGAGMGAGGAGSSSGLGPDGARLPVDNGDEDDEEEEEDDEDQAAARAAQAGGRGHARPLPRHAVLATRGRTKKFEARGSAFRASAYSEAELLELAGIVDSAIMRCFAALHSIRHLDRHVFKPNRIDVADAASFLRAQARHHSLALFYAGRGMAKDALAVWRELGLGTAREREELPAESDAIHARARGRGSEASGAESGASSSRRSSTASSRDQAEPRSDSLSDFDEVLSHPAYVNGGRGDQKDEGGDAAAGAGGGGSNRSGAGVGAGGGGGGAADVTALAIALAKESSAVQPDGVDDTIAFLRACEDPALIFEFSEWLLLRHPARGMAVFTAPRRSRSLADDTVLEYLSAQKFADMARRNPASGVVRMFLEYLIDEVGSTEERYHTRLAREYIASVGQLRGDVPGGGSVYTPGLAGGKDALAARMALAGTVAERPAPGSEGGMLGELRGKLVRLLQESDRFDSGALLALVRDTTLYEERVLLHARLGQHEDALHILVNELADADRAVRYCEIQTRMKGSAWAAPSASGPAASGSDPFLCLLRLYLDAHQAAIASSGAGGGRTGGGGTVRTVYLGRALDLLSSHAHQMDALAAAKLLPGDLPLHSLLGYCSRVLPTSAHAAREALVVRNLHNYRYIDVHADLIERQVRSVTVTRNSFCHVCDKRIGDAVFAVLPDNRPVHFHCSRDLTAGALASAASGSAASGASGASAATAAANRRATLFRLYDVRGAGAGAGDDEHGLWDRSGAGLNGSRILFQAQGRTDEDDGDAEDDDEQGGGGVSRRPGDIDFSHEFGTGAGDEYDAAPYLRAGKIAARRGVTGGGAARRGRAGTEDDDDEGAGGDDEAEGDEEEEDAPRAPARGRTGAAAGAGAGGSARPSEPVSGAGGSGPGGGLPRNPSARGLPVGAGAGGAGRK